MLYFTGEVVEDYDDLEEEEDDDMEDEVVLLLSDFNFYYLSMNILVVRICHN